MSEDTKRTHPSPGDDALKKLLEDMAALNTRADLPLGGEDDMISLIVSGALRGEELASQYPALARKLLEQPELREIFLDVLESVEAERTGQMVPLPVGMEADLSFLTKTPSHLHLERRTQENWRATWRRTLDELQAIFVPQRLVYRAEVDLVEDPWFTLLREELYAGGTTYAVALECTISSDTEDSLAAYLDLAVTIGSGSEIARFPLQATMHWGTYEAKVQIREEGRVRFPDVPLQAVYDPQQKKIRADLNLTLESAP
jgi:hypothetical protein